MSLYSSNYPPGAEFDDYCPWAPTSLPRESEYDCEWDMPVNLRRVDPTETPTDSPKKEVAL